ncbi:MAG: c-type cytochrome [Cyclobacteriaceae bacterium]
MKLLFFQLIALCAFVVHLPAQVLDSTAHPAAIDIDLDTMAYSFVEGQIPDTIPVYNKLVRSGEALFTQHCNMCHAVGYEMVGPALADVHRKQPLSWLFRWIRDPAQVIASGDEYARYIDAQYDTLMPSFNFLSDNQIFAILAYIKKEAQYDSLPTSIARIEEGKQLFSQYCYQCHAVGMQKFGPALASVYKRHGSLWLLNFIKNSQEVIASGDDYANFLYERYNNMVMPNFEFLSDEEVFSILAYIKEESEPPFDYKQYSSRVTATVDRVGAQPEAEAETNGIGWTVWALIGAVLVLGIGLVYMIFRFISVRM